MKIPMKMNVKIVTNTVLNVTGRPNMIVLNVMV